MKKFITYSFFVLGLGCLGSGCEKSELTGYEEPPMVFIYKDGYDVSRDSISYSFAVKPASLQFDTVKVPLRIMGDAAPKDRVVGVKVVQDSTTAVQGTDFDLGPTVIPAGAFTSSINVVVKRNAGLKNKEVRLMVEIEASEDFLPGISNAKAENATWGAGLTYLIKLNDFFSKPDNWDSRLSYYFGAFSQRKFGFIIEVTGMTEFPTSGPDQLPYGIFTYLKTLCHNKWLEYVEANGPMIDEETGNEVIFP